MKHFALSIAFVALQVSANSETPVSVCGDATFIIEGSICSGPTNLEPHGTACPKKGQVASSDCYKYLYSYDEYDQKCIAPEDALCERLYTGSWGCVFPSVECGKDTPAPVPCPTTAKPTPCPTTEKPTPCPTTEKPTPCPTPAPTGTPVSVCKDATYTIAGKICSGSANGKPYGVACPNKGDVASADCHKYLYSYDEYEQKCIAPENAVCKRIFTGAWGCVFPSLGCKENTLIPTPTPTTPKPTPTPVCNNCTYRFENPQIPSYPLEPEHTSELAYNINDKGEVNNHIVLQDGTPLNAGQGCNSIAVYWDDNGTWNNQFIDANGMKQDMMNVFYVTAQDKLIRRTYQTTWSTLSQQINNKTIKMELICNNTVKGCIKFNNKQ